MPNFLLLATAWGPKFGGVNAFNVDFAAGLAKYMGKKGTVFCAVLKASQYDIENARNDANVTLISLDKDPSASRFDTSWALEALDILKKHHDFAKIDYWVGHDVVSSAAAKRGANASEGSCSAVIMHMNYEAYQSYKTRVGEVAKEKFLAQKDAFSGADFFFANGPLLTAALKDMVSTNVVQLIPGFADIKTNPTNAELTSITFGRMDRENDRIKQGSLSVAGFGLAVRYAQTQPLAPTKLKNSPRIYVVGIDEPGGEDEKALQQLAHEKAERPVVINA